ncbi:CbtB domain-containing protein [Saccharopolyspora spinosa]|uniref:Cobalt transporter subunit CbtB n=1 Tax=Saccharopolyspora spinosa TaxID=60894 RepID=A0A2N3XZX4_SACSN|nr:CbtB-domain containing protein [Saccharopolyspora spinosa]PKW16218.1 putative cobalt transporter subunit CbtB [Saccharopolyspora spinosa]
MTTAGLAPDAIRVHVPVWAWALAAFAIVVLYVVLQENGALLAQAADTVHEFTHDGRHALGVPCH